MYPIFKPHQAQNKSLAQAGIDPCHLNLKHFDLTSTPPGLFLKTASFLSYLILVFHIVANFQLSSSSKQLVGTGGNRSVPLRLETLWFDPYNIKAITGRSYFSFVFNPRLLYCSQLSTLINLKTIGWHRRESIPCHLNLKHFDLTSTPPGLLLKTISLAQAGIETGYLHLVNLGVTTTQLRLMLKEVTCLLSLILVFHIVTNLQTSSSSKKFVGTSRNRHQLLSFETPLLDFYTNKVIAAGGYFFSYLFLVFYIVNNFHFSTLIKLKTSRWHSRESTLVT